MTQYKTPQERDEEFIEQLQDLEPRKMEIWRYYADRADKLSDQIWTTGTWMLGIIGAVLTLPFATKFIVVDPARFVKIESRTLTFAICIFGIILCLYSYTVLTEIRQRLQRNWERSDLARTGNWRKSDWSGQRHPVWWILMVFGSFSFIAFFVLAILTIINP